LKSEKHARASAAKAAIKEAHKDEFSLPKLGLMTEMTQCYEQYRFLARHESQRGFGRDHIVRLKISLLFFAGFAHL